MAIEIWHLIVTGRCTLQKFLFRCAPAFPTHVFECLTARKVPKLPSEIKPFPAYLQWSKQKNRECSQGPKFST